MFNTILKSISFLTKNSESKRQLGRWSLDYCQIALDNKIAYANEDNCGYSRNMRIQKILADDEANRIKSNREIKDVDDITIFSSNQNVYKKQNETSPDKRTASKDQERIEQIDSEIMYYLCM